MVKVVNIYRTAYVNLGSCSYKTNKGLRDSLCVRSQAQIHDCRKQKKNTLLLGVNTGKTMFIKMQIFRGAELHWYPTTTSQGSSLGRL